MTDVPNVTIGGRAFPVPPLAIKQLRTVVPGLFKLQEVMRPGEALNLDNDTFDLLLNVVFVGISAGSPGFSQGAFNDLSATPMELVAALAVVSQQTGMSKAGEEPAGVGEVAATA